MREELTSAYKLWKDQYRKNGMSFITYQYDHPDEHMEYTLDQPYSEEFRRYLGIYINPLNITANLLVNSKNDCVPTNEHGNRYANFILGKVVYHMRERKQGRDVQWVQTPETSGATAQVKSPPVAAARRLSYDDGKEDSEEDESYAGTIESDEDTLFEDEDDEDYETDESRPRKRRRGKSTPKSKAKAKATKKKATPRTTPRKVVQKTKKGTRIGAAASLHQVLLDEQYRFCKLGQIAPEALGERRLKIYANIFKGFNVASDPHNRVLDQIIGIYAKIRLVMAPEYAFRHDEYEAMAKAVILYYREVQGDQGKNGHGAWTLPAVHLLNGHLVARKLIPLTFDPDIHEDRKIAQGMRVLYDTKVWVGGKIGLRENRPEVIKQLRFLLRELGEDDEPPEDEGDPNARHPSTYPVGSEMRPFLLE